MWMVDWELTSGGQYPGFVSPAEDQFCWYGDGASQLIAWTKGGSPDRLWGATLPSQSWLAMLLQGKSEAITRVCCGIAAWGTSRGRNSCVG
jgi:hypothetical protein